MKFLFLAILAFTCVLAAPVQKKGARDGGNESRDLDFDFSADMDTMLTPAVKQRAARSVRFSATITFAANAEAWVYVNQVEKGHLNDPHEVKQVTVEVMRGDVIALKATSKGHVHGVAVSVEYEGKNHVSNWQQKGSWKARKAVGYISYWMSNRYSSCTWLNPAQPEAAVVKAEKFPYATGARYVWANRVGLGDQNTIWMRHVVGEEDCDDQTPATQPRKRLVLCDLRKGPCANLWGVPTTTPPRVTLTNTKNALTGKEEECRCRVTVGPVGKCYRMHFPGSKFGRCEPYICGPSYECIEGDGEHLQKCVKRVAKVRTLPHPTYKKYCENISITPMYFYILSSK